jgi:hypothetical protein
MAADYESRARIAGASTESDLAEALTEPSGADTAEMECAPAGGQVRRFGLTPVAGLPEDGSHDEAPVPQRGEPVPYPAGEIRPEGLLTFGLIMGLSVPGADAPCWSEVLRPRPAGGGRGHGQGAVRDRAGVHGGGAACPLRSRPGVRFELGDPARDQRLGDEPDGFPAPLADRVPGPRCLDAMDAAQELVRPARGLVAVA